MMNIFEDLEMTSKGVFRYDINSFESSSSAVDGFQQYRFDEPKENEFYLTDDQKNMVTKYIKIYGKTPVGVGRIFSKLYVKKIFRNVRY